MVISCFFIPATTANNLNDWDELSWKFYLQFSTLFVRDQEQMVPSVALNFARKDQTYVVLHRLNVNVVIDKQEYGKNIPVFMNSLNQRPM